MKKNKLISLTVTAAVTLSAVSTSVFAATSIELETLEGHTSATCFTYEENNRAWAHLWNPYNEASLFNTPDKSVYESGAKDLIVEFSVAGLEEPFSVFPGYQAYGDEEGDSEELSIWSQDDYNNAVGSDYTYTIDQDGTYEMVIPFRAMADAALDFWGENLVRVGILELCFDGIGNDDMTGFKYDGLSIEFIGVKQSKISHTVEECAFSGGEPVKFSDTEEENADSTSEEEGSEAEASDVTEKSEESSAETAVSDTENTVDENHQGTTAATENSSSKALNPLTTFIIIVIAAVLVIAVAVIIVVVKKKK